MHNATMPLLHGIVGIMVRNKTTWSNVSGSWRNGKTRVIRVPENLADDILNYARKLDSGTQENNHNIQLIVSEFIELKRTRTGAHHTQKGKPLNRNSPRWSVFNEFCEWLTTRSLL